MIEISKSIRRKVYLYTYKKRQRLINKNKSIWHFCTPKSASTYLTQIFQQLLSDECSFGTSVPYHGGRSQNLSINTVSSYITKNKIYFSKHTHTKYSDYLENYFLNKNSKIILQTRNIADTCLSLKEHLDRGLDQPFILSAPKYWNDLNNEDKYELVARAYVPWHFDFLVSWKLFENCYRVNYTELISDTFNVIQNICEYITLPKTNDEINSAINVINETKNEDRNYNVGISGRGKKKITKKAIKIIEQTSEFYEKMLYK